jgi:MFS transporter, PPP family, 3-phenylpropionic acid transporter
MPLSYKIRAIYFFAFCAHGAWVPRFAEFLKAHDITGWHQGLIMSITPALMFLLQPFHGMWADKSGYRSVLLISSIVSAVSFIVFYYVGGSVWLIVGITAFLSIFYNGVQPVIDSLALKLSEDDPQFSYGTMRIAGALGWSIIGAIGGYVISSYGIGSMFLLASLSMGIATILTLSLPVDMGTNSNPGQQPAKQSMSSLLLQPKMMIFVTAIVLISIFSTAMWNFYSVYLEEIGGSKVLAGWGYAYHGLCELPFFFFSAYILKRFGVYPTLIFTVLTTAIRMFLYSIVKDPYVAIAIETLQGTSWSLFWVACVEYINSLVDSKWRATAQSLLYAAYFGIGAIIGNLWASELNESMPLSNVFLINSVAVFAIVALMLLFYKKLNKQDVKSANKT